MDRVVHFCGAGFVKNLLQFVHRFLIDFTQRSRSRFIVIGAQRIVQFIGIFGNPLPNRTLFRMECRGNSFRMDAVAHFQNVFANGLFDGKLLATFFRFSKVAQLLTQFSQSLNDIGGSISARAAGFARHALSAVPNGFTFEQREDGLVVAGLYLVANNARIVIVKLCSRANSGANATVHTCVEPILKANIFCKKII